MATQYPSGVQGKNYEIIGNYVNGINRNISDTTIPENYFRELTNFSPDKEGTLSKRNGLYDSRLNHFFDRITRKDYDNEKVLVNINAYDHYNANMSPETDGYNKNYILSNEGHLERFNDVIFNGKKVFNQVLDSETVEGYTNYTRVFAEPKETIFMEIVDNKEFLDLLQNGIDEILDGGQFRVSGDYYNFEFIIVQRVNVGQNQCDSKGNVDETTKWTYNDNGLFIYHVHISVEKGITIYSDTGIKVYNSVINIVMDERSVFDDYHITYGTPKFVWKYDLDKSSKYGSSVSKYDTINFEKYNGYYYAATGTNFIIKMKEKFEEKELNIDLNFLETTIDQIGGRNNGYWNVYKPVPLEVMNIGFNILAPNTMEYIDNQGNVSIVKGIFYSIQVDEGNGVLSREPVQKIPFNKPFYMNIIYTGDTTPEKPQYRPDNGEVDTAKNPYKTLPGSYTTTTGGVAIFYCDGINDANNIEVKVNLGDTPFINYATTGASHVPEVGRVSEINDLILSSTHCKVIGNQLVLYGGHGYMFFSDYENFEYFPNYYYVYVAESGLEEVTAIKYFRQYYAIFTNKRIKRMAGTFGASDFGIYPLNDSIGCNISMSVKQVKNNLLFIGNDGLYMLKQGYLGEGTENVEKIDKNLNEVLNYLNVLQCFVLGQYYVILLNDGKTMYVYDTDNNAYYEYQFASDKETETHFDNIEGFEHFNFLYAFQSQIYDEHGGYLLIPEYDFLSFNIQEIERGKMKLRIFRFNNLDFLELDQRTTDSRAFISTLETPYINMGYPTNTKKFKSLFIKYSNESGARIPLYLTIMIDGFKTIDPENYEIIYDEETETYLYKYVMAPNQNLKDIELSGDGILGTLELGEGVIGGKTSFQLKLKINTKGRNIKIILTDGYDKKLGFNNYEYHRNPHNFTIEAMGIIYKLKKVKEG